MQVFADGVSRVRVLAALAAAALAHTGCGYHFVGGRDVFGPDVHSIELFAFENETREPGLEQLIAQALNEEFARRGWLEPKLEGQISSPDLVMRGVIHTVTVHSSSYSSSALALEEAVDVVLDVNVRRAQSTEVVWQHPHFRVHEVFRASADPQVYASNKEQALRRVSSEIAQRVHDELFQRF
jgi:hypothetical protein